MQFFLLVFVQMFLIVAKVTETVDWSWWVIFTPIYVALLGFLIVMTMLVSVVSKIQTQRRAFR